MVETKDTRPNDAELRKLYGSWIKRTALMLKSRMPWADLDELLQLGAVGMLEALQRFDSTRGVDFQAFCSRRIRGAMIDGLRREGALQRGEAPFDADKIDTAALVSGDSPEDPFTPAYALRQQKVVGGSSEVPSAARVSRARTAFLRRDEQP